MKWPRKPRRNRSVTTAGPITRRGITPCGWTTNKGSHSHGQSLAQSAWDDAEADKTFTRLERAAIDLADTLKSEEEENRPEVSGVYADLLGAAVSEIDWDEIATNMLENVDQTETCGTCSGVLDDDGKCQQCDLEDESE